MESFRSSVEMLKGPQKIKLMVQKQTNFGEVLCCSGSSKEFGRWNTDNALKLTWNPDHMWSVELQLVPGTFNYKYFILNERTKQITWEGGSNRELLISEISQKEWKKDVWQDDGSATRPCNCAPIINELEDIVAQQRRELESLLTTVHELGLENSRLCGENIGDMKLVELQHLQNRLVKSFLKVNKALLVHVEKDNCSICYENERNICLIPCGHFVLCENCANRDLKCCPFCRKAVTRIQKIYH
eukprot:TRINITY_DN3324_c0_g1_i1.p1 TRINITY_DN3324_c0_g1~~TRINITY_DN3324_c0_g1_i1.p1  ORF type:complete len:244 (-),score=24.99 TRINITY_DN3324_c0_g1_i1:37-768(-)